MGEVYAKKTKWERKMKLLLHTYKAFRTRERVSNP